MCNFTDDIEVKIRLKDLKGLKLNSDVCDILKDENDNLKNENENLKKEIAELKSIIETLKVSDQK